MVIRAYCGMVCVVLITMCVPQIMSANLKNFDQKKYDIALKLNNHPSFTRGKVDFFVCYTPASFLFGAFTLPSIYPNTVFLSPSIIDDPYLDANIAHELGHLQFRHGYFGNAEITQSEADTFAANIVGKERMINLRLSMGFTEDHYLIRNLKK